MCRSSERTGGLDHKVSRLQRSSTSSAWLQDSASRTVRPGQPCAVAVDTNTTSSVQAPADHAGVLLYARLYQGCAVARRCKVHMRALDSDLTFWLLPNSTRPLTPGSYAESISIKRPVQTCKWRTLFRLILIAVVAIIVRIELSAEMQK